MFGLFPLFGLLPCLAAARATPSLQERAASAAAAAAACSAIKSTIGVNVFMKGDSQYSSEQDNYWNAGLCDNSPACIVMPTDTAEVVEAVSVLKQYPDAYYAVKSGGHDPNPHHSAIDGGVLISLFLLAGAKYDAEAHKCYVKPGGRWSDVISDLQPSGYAVIGGRLGLVGVGGYITGGGLSFLSAQYGLAADTVLEFETVMANGSVAHINAENNADLFRAMKGSTNQYGIVTQFTMKPIPIKQVWGGTRLYTALSLDELYSNFADFTSDPVDPKAAIILTIEFVAGNFIPVMFYFYDGAEPSEGAFKGFLDLPYLVDSTKTQSYGDLLAANAAGAGNLTTRTSFSSVTLPLLPGDDGPALLKDVIDDWSQSDYFKNPLHAVTVGSIAFQSFPNLIGKQSEASGGNAMGLSGSDGPRFIVEQSYLYSGGASDDQAIWSTSQALVKKLQNEVVPAYVAKLEAEGQSVQAYQPYFANDALFTQPVYQSYKEYELFKQLQVENDPDGFISKRAGGFKY